MWLMSFLIYYTSPPAATADAKGQEEFSNNV